MSTDPHTEAGGLAAALCSPMCHHEGAYRECDKFAEAALSWLTARLTDDDCARIVHASIDPDRVFGGIDGYDGGEADVLLTTVECIVAAHIARIEAERDRLRTVIHDTLTMLCERELFAEAVVVRGLLDGGE